MCDKQNSFRTAEWLIHCVPCPCAHPLLAYGGYGQAWSPISLFFSSDSGELDWQDLIHMEFHGTLSAPEDPTLFNQ